LSLIAQRDLEPEHIQACEHCLNVPGDSAVKRIFDLLLVLLFAPLWLLSLLFIAILVKNESQGAVLYKQKRVGFRGTTFNMLKFRTMHQDSDHILEEHLKASTSAHGEWTERLKLRVDPRATALGRFLRTYSLDELPQLWNVLEGHMSLVGPRPIYCQRERNAWGERFHFYTHVRPGMTGLWQVSGRSDTSYAERVELDCRYIQDWSLRFDLSILARTPYAVLSAKGAY
jgi:lipopolysaccharide/colanic/teichoic acid biosynthesis glycosyltransferase